MKICIAGKCDLSVWALEYLISEKGIPVGDLCVIPNECVEDDDTWQLSLKKIARDYNVPIEKIENLYSIDDLIFLSIQYEKIINPDYFKSKKLFNIHFAPLPKYKGMYTSIIPILNGEKKTGVTIHKIDKGIDSGDIISQIEFDIEIADTMRDVYFKYIKYGYDLFKDTICDILEDTYTSASQSFLDSTITYGRDLEYKKANIDLRRTSFQIHNNIRAFIFPEFQLPEIRGYKIYKSVLNNERIEPFTFEVKEDYILISGMDGYAINAYYE